MKKFVFLVAYTIFVAVVAVSCTQQGHHIGADGYYFEHETFTRTEFPVEIHLVQSEAEMTAEIEKRMKSVSGTIEPKNVAAFSIISEENNKCVIYMIDPKVSYQPEFYGHELVHCVYGVWHHEPQS